MIELRVLGPLRIGASDRPRVDALARQAKRAALLAYLGAATPRGAHPRDKLLALFWPESDAAHARAALSQAVYVLRSTLGEGVVISHGDGRLELAWDRLWCDAAAFEEALDAGRLAEALSHYGGDFLDGWFPGGGPDFEQWVDGERERLRTRAAAGAWALADALAAAGDPLEGIRRARWAARLQPADETAIRRLMTFLETLGDGAAAVRAYEAFAWRLGDEYGLEPSAETQELAARLQRHAAPPAPGAGRRPVAVTPPRRSVRPAVLALTALVVVATVLVGWAARGRAERTPPPVTRFLLGGAGMPPLAGGIGGSTIAVSPAGTHVAWVGEAAEDAQIFVRALDRLDARPVPHTRGARLPFFSPDGAWLGFVTGTTLRKVRLSAGPAITIAVAEANVVGASWGPRDTIVFATPAGLWLVPAGGGAPGLLAAADTAAGERYRWPEVLPSGEAAVFTRAHPTGNVLARASLATGAVTLLGIEGTSPRFVPPRHLVLARADGALLVAPFDPDDVRVLGAPLPLEDGVYVGIAGAAKVGVAMTGALAYVPEPAQGALVLVDRRGRAESGPRHARGVTSVRFSPDGSRFAAVMTPETGDHPDLWLLERAGTLRRITFDSGSVAPVWTPDGRHIAFASKPGGRTYGFRIRQMAADGVSAPETLTPAAHRMAPLGFTPDGRTLVFQRSPDGRRWSVWSLRVDPVGAPVPYGDPAVSRWSAALSRDGERLAWVSDVSGRAEVYVGGYPEPGTPVQVSMGGGSEPRWSGNRAELFYRGAEGTVAVVLDPGAEPAVRNRTVLFDGEPYLASRIGTTWDVHPDGQRFAMIRRNDAGAGIVVVLNWLERMSDHR